MISVNNSKLLNGVKDVKALWRMVFNPLRSIIILALLILSLPLPAAETFRIATYNVENYLDQPSGSRPAKSEQARNKVLESIL